MSRLEVIDFDRTSFDTDLFSETLVTRLADEDHLTSHERDAVLEALEAPDTADIVELLRQYDIAEAHITQMAAALEGDFVYPDARRFIHEARHVLVLTTAVNVAFQEAKLTQASLDARHKIVTGNKGVFLRGAIQELPEGLVLPDYDGQETFGWMRLVDDRFNALQPLLWQQNVELRMMVRPDAKYRPTEVESRSIGVIASFDEIAD